MVLLKKLPKKVGDLGNFLIPRDFLELDECLALADLGASINLMPLSVWKKLSLPELTSTHMTLELTNRSVAYPVGVAKDVFVKVGKFHFLADFVVVDYDVDPQVPLILERPFLRTARAFIDVHGEELILRDGDEQLIFHADSTSKHPNKHGDESINMINFIDITCEDRFLEVLKLKKSNYPSSRITTPLFDSLPTLTPFETSDSLLEEFVDELAFLDPFSPGIDDTEFDPEGDIRLLEKLSNDDPSSPLPPKELHFEELKMIKSSIDDSSPLDVLGDNSVTFSNPLVDANDDFTSSNDESLPEEDALLVTPLFDANEDECFDPRGNIDEIDAFLYINVSTDIEDGYHDSEGDIIYLECLLTNDTTHNSPPVVFLDHDPRSLKDEPDNEDLKSIVKVFDPWIHEKFISLTYVRLPFEDRHYFSLTFVIRIFLPYLTYSKDSSLLLSSGSEDTIFDPDISIFSCYSLEPVVSHQSGTFMCFNVYLNILNESPMDIFSSTCFVPNIMMIWGESS
ncbi:reverse transcriptase domain-containing protein [Tanacetum coccineum]